MTDSLRDRIAAVIARYGEDFCCDECPQPQPGVFDCAAADAVIAALPTEPSDAGERLDCIGRWMKPSLWSALDGRREAILRILKGEIIEPPEWDDSLRDRIAAAMNVYAHQHADWMFADLADAVIAALGLPPTWGKPSFDNGN